MMSMFSMLVVIMLFCGVYIVYTCHRRCENGFFSRIEWQEDGASAAAAAPASAATSVQAELSEDCGSSALVVY